MEEEIASLKNQVQKLQAALNAGGTLLAARAIDVETLQSKVAAQEVENRVVTQRLQNFEKSIEESIQQHWDTIQKSRNQRPFDFDF